MIPDDATTRGWKSSFPVICAAILLTIHAVLLACAARWDSPTVDEPAHLAAGISHWKFGRFESYRVNPPFVRMLAALPVLAMGHESDWSEFSEERNNRHEFLVGHDFVRANGPRIFPLTTYARWACIPLSLLGGWVCFCWARNLYGATAGLMALTLWCFCPNILGHGHLITPDVPAASFGVLAAYAFWKWLQSPDWTLAAAAGVALGLAEATKTTWIVLFLLWPIVWLAVRLSGKAMSWRQWGRETAQLSIQFVLAVFVLNALYGFEKPFERLDQFQFISHTLTNPEPDAPLNAANPVLPTRPNRFSGTLLGGVRLPLPANLVLGIDSQKRDFEAFPTPSYLAGEFSRQGWWYYYLYGFAVKVPLGMSLLLVVGILLRPWSKRRWRDDVVLLGPAVVVLLIASSQTGINQHFRYVLPAFPFLLIWANGLVATSTFRWLCPIQFGCIMASVLSSLSIYPHSIAYFNELAGGPMNGHHHLINSNIDWGQDLLRLKEWQRDHPEARPLYLFLHGVVDPSHAGIRHKLPDTAPSETMVTNGTFTPGWYAVSINRIVGFPEKLDPSHPCNFSNANEFAWLDQQPVVAHIGYSIRVYELHKIK